MKFAAFAVVALMLAGSTVRAAEPLIVHEWGTFTCLQDETGRAIGAINTDDEPVPVFVHHAAILINDSDRIVYEAQAKWTPICNPAVTMRLETPVIYFHRSAGEHSQKVSVNVAFHGGWLTEFYPMAEAQAPGLQPIATAEGGAGVRGLTADTIGTLSWPVVRIGVAGNIPATDSKVWTTPRQAHSDSVVVGNESEQFLFYRGVGHLDSPLRVARMEETNELQISTQGLSGRGKALLANEAELAHSPMWLVNVSDNGHVLWRRGYSPVPAPRSAEVLGEMSAADTVGLKSLHVDMAKALAKAGLFSDEAEAMLNTWEVSYFKSPGTRLFFLVPKHWTDEKLPLRISGQARITRVMVGRIEIVTPEQRDLIRTIEASAPLTHEPEEVAQAVTARVKAGEPLSEAVAQLSPADRAYVLLGRFRDSLLIDEQARHSNGRLGEFMSDHSIHPTP